MGWMLPIEKPQAPAVSHQPGLARLVLVDE
jgi:hypothetical protein